MKRILITAGIFFFCSVSASVVVACTCTDYSIPTCKRFQSADATFFGKIERITSAVGDKDANVSLGGVGSISSIQSGLIWVHFKVEKAFRGNVGQRIKVLTYRGTSCDLEVKQGQRWMVFAQKDDETGFLSFGACGGNYELSKDDPDIKELEALAKGTAATTVRGNVTLDRFNGLEGAKVTLTGRGLERTTVTDKSGTFVFDVPEAGTYRVKVIVPFSAILMRFRGDDRRISENPTEAETSFEYDAAAVKSSCDYQVFEAYKIDLKATASISGKLIHKGWKLTPKIYPRVCKLMATEKATLESCRSIYEVSMDGSFEVGGLREGRYTLMAGEPDFPDGSSPFLTHYYPGAGDFFKAGAIVLEQGEEKRGIEFNLPPMQSLKEITGQVYHKNGEPAKVALDVINNFYMSAHNYVPGQEPKLLFMHDLLLAWGNNVEEKSIEMVDIADDGSFKLTLFEGYKYILSVETNSWGEKRQCGMLKVDVDSNLKGPLRLVLNEKGVCDEKEFARKLDSESQKRK